MEKINWSFVNVLVTLAIIWFLNSGNNVVVVPPGSDTVKVIEKYYDTVHYTTETKLQSAATKIIEVPVPADVDTAKILQAFYNAYTYVSDVSDSNITGYVKDSISRNLLLKQKFTYKLNRPFVTTTTTVINKPADLCKDFIYSFSVGAFAYSNLLRNGYGIDVGFANKKLNVGAGYDLKNKGVLVRGGLNFVRIK